MDPKKIASGFEKMEAMRHEVSSIGGLILMHAKRAGFRGKVNIKLGHKNLWLSFNPDNPTDHQAEANLDGKRLATFDKICLADTKLLHENLDKFAEAMARELPDLQKDLELLEELGG
ncbi:MAG: hypothetical protein Q8Q18_01640 [bacterium]|nr:hypothetical protein [bacterium]